MTIYMRVPVDDLATTVRAFHALQLAVQQLTRRPDLNAPPHIIQAARVLSGHAADSLVALSDHGQLEFDW